MNHTYFGIAMIVGGVILASGGVVVLMRRGIEPSTKHKSASTSTATTDQGQSRKNLRLTPEEKGNLFEKWVVKRFSRNLFTIKEWRGDKYVDGIYAESSTHPDLEIEFYMGNMRQLFAVECKWRSRYDPGEKPTFDWATGRQIENYRNFAKARNMPVFVVIAANPTTPTRYSL
ncbi:MAG: hypothetical protein LH606_10030 [Cytophagaceae bacterium]|nr:hypothetical protein [Cytophagaceae bacterium]